MIAAVAAGTPEPLGVSPDAGGANVAIFSAHATAIEFCLFDPSGEREVQRVALPERTGDVFHGRLAGVTPGARYGFRAHGPFDPDAGHRFNPAKLLIDPHAQAIDRPFRLHPAMFGYPPGSGDDAAFDPTDSAPFMPKAVVVPAADPASPPPLPWTPWASTVLYELNVRGFTMRHEGVPEALRGTFAGLAHPAAVAHLVRLGVTTVEIMPCAAWIDERHLAALGRRNYWGYNPVIWPAPEPRLAPGGWDEIRQTVAALAAAGIETVVDVVLNHTGEGDALGPTLSLRGLDNASYYRLMPGDLRRYVDDSGCGNTLALDRAPVVRLAMDALRTWVRRAGVQGFRFDLATCLGRRPEGFDRDSPLLAAIQQDPELRGCKLIAEPWDIGPGGYQLGRFPAEWGEWNDRFRDDVRRFWRGDPHMLGALGSRLAGSADLFGPHRPTSRSVNFVTAHDGFTLADLVAHERKHNEANGEGNRDGSDVNHSWNNGAEGATDDPAIAAARRSDQRALLATLLLARGTPMLAMGAELGHSQGGNNNGYTLDDETGWLDWAAADDELIAFTARLLALRRGSPLLHGDRPLTGAADGGIADVEWLGPDAAPLRAQDWDRAEPGPLLMLLGGAGERAGVLVHRGRASCRFALPASRGGRSWVVRLDTAGEPRAARDAWIEVAPRSVVVIEERLERATGVGSATLARLATAAGIAAEWWSVDGVRHDVGDDTRRALLAAMGLPAGSEGEARDSLARLGESQVRALPEALVGIGGGVVLPLAFAPGLNPSIWLEIAGEEGRSWRFASTPDRSEVRSLATVDGRRVAQRLVRLPELPVGRYTVRRDDAPDVPCRLTIAPPTAWLPESIAGGGRLLGIAAQLYALRRPGDQGIGDFTTLAELARLTAAAGGAAVGINPLHALFPTRRERASPYYPSDRRFRDPLSLDLAALTELPGGERLRRFLAERERLLAELSARELVDHRAVWREKAAGLRLLFDDFDGLDSGERDEFDRYCARGGDRLQGFAVFSALAQERAESSWQEWPARLRDPGGAAVAEFAASRRGEVRFHAFQQWLCERQLAAAAEDGRKAGLELGIYGDIAVGAAPDGAEIWALQHLFAQGASIGAPPDPLGPDGQVWGLPPPLPHAMRAEGYAHFSGLLRANMSHMGAVRIDHAMALQRLFWVPQGAAARDGAYVAYPLADLLGEVCLESRLARCMVVAEDLGTVPPGFRESLARADVLGYRVGMLEREGGGFRSPAQFPARAVACLGTHDLPTFAGWWRGADLAERRRLGLLDQPEAEQQAEARAEERRALAAMLDRSDESDEAEILDAAHEALAASDSALVMLQLDDLAGEVAAVNVPGTVEERPNWRRRMAMTVADAFRVAAERVATLARTRGS